MKSATKQSLNRNQIEAVVKAQFGEDVELMSFEELTDGWFNTAYSVKFSSSVNTLCTVVLKVAPSQDSPLFTYEARAMEVETHVMGTLIQNTDIPIPKLLGVDFSHRLIPNNYFFMEKLVGKPWNKIKSSLSEKKNNTIQEQLGKYQYVLNNIQGDHFGSILDPKNCPNTWYEIFYQMGLNLFHDYDRYRVKMPQPFQMFLSLIEENKSYLLEVKTPYLVHWDLWEGNVFVKQDGDEVHIEGIFDFERAFWGDPLCEVIFREPQKYPLVVAQYGRDFLKTKSAQIRRFLYNFYLYLVWYLECYVRKYPFFIQIGFKFIAKRNFKKDFKQYNKFLKNT